MCLMKSLLAVIAVMPSAHCFWVDSEHLINAFLNIAGRLFFLPQFDRRSREVSRWGSLRPTDHFVSTESLLLSSAPPPPPPSASPSLRLSVARRLLFAGSLRWRCMSGLVPCQRTPPRTVGSWPGLFVLNNPTGSVNPARHQGGASLGAYWHSARQLLQYRWALWEMHRMFACRCVSYWRL